MILGLKCQALQESQTEEAAAADHVEEAGMRTKEVDLMDDSMVEGRVDLLGLLDLVELEDSTGEVVFHNHIFLDEEDNDWLGSYYVQDQPPMMSLEFEELKQLLLVPILEE